MKALVKNIIKVVQGYNTLEFNLETGGRGSRYTHVEKMISDLTGSESAVVVNNNAAAVMIVLNEFAKHRESVVSRGELVEIGGSFRIPDIMRYSGSTLVEVGTTNRTHEVDYRDAVTEETGVFLKVHTSNYKIMGFTKAVSNTEIVNLAKELNLEKKF